LRRQYEHAANEQRRKKFANSLRGHRV
jgi:hypothetical protein